MISEGYNSKLKVLIACEESQTVTKAFLALGHDAYSCDILPCSGQLPQRHFKCDIFTVIKQRGGILESGHVINDNRPWDLMIAHPPCTYLSVSGARWYYHPDDWLLPNHMKRPHPKFPDRAFHREKAVEFFIKLWEAPIRHIAIENPVGIMSTRLCPPHQKVHPFHFGDSARKNTCLWLKNLPLLQHTNVVDEGERTYFYSGRSQPKWYSDALINAKTTEERRTLRSKTFQGMAKAMAEQWAHSVKELNFEATI